MAKTELLIPLPLPTLLLPITVDNPTILPVTQACTLGVIFSSDLSLGPHSQAMSRAWRFFLQNIPELRPFLSIHAAKTHPGCPPLVP